MASLTLAFEQPKAARFRFVRTVLRHRGLTIGLALLGFLAVVATLAPAIAPYGPTATDLSHTLAQPSSTHLLGTDQYGRDVLSRLIWGTRISLGVAFWVVLVSLTLGALIGSIAGFFGGWIDRGLTAFNEMMLAFPGFLLALALVAARGSTLENVILAIAIAYTPRVAIVMRSIVLTIRPRLYVEAAQALGASPLRVLFRHVVPNSLPPVIVVATVSAATAILGEAGLSFLGLGVQQPAATWGNVIGDGQNYIQSNPWISVSAGLCIAIAVVGFNLLGDGLRDTLDPQLKKQTAAKLL
jgi:peptide/nickel transport system permease protein